MQVPSTIVKKMAIGAGTLALAGGAVYAATYKAPAKAGIAQTASAEPAPEPIPVPVPEPAPRPVDPCPACGMG